MASTQIKHRIEEAKREVELQGTSGAEPNVVFLAAIGYLVDEINLGFTLRITGRWGSAVGAGIGAAALFIGSRLI